MENNKEVIERYVRMSSDLDYMGDLVMETEEAGGSLTYTNRDLINALLIFHHVFGNRSMCKGIVDNLPDEDQVAKSKHYWVEITRMVKEATGVDVSKVLSYDEYVTE